MDFHESNRFATDGDKRVAVVDIDETICFYVNDRIYEHAVPNQNNIDKINRLYDDGKKIIYWTARGTVTKIDWIELTRQQLFEWGCKCHDVRVGKPQYDLWIDDKSMRIEEV